MSAALLSSTYFGPIQWYQKLYRSEVSYIDSYETFQKQTFRNRCLIATANGVQSLTVPIEHTSDSKTIRDIRISSHGRWQHQHWQALQSAYGDSPFFMYLSDDIRPFFEKQWKYLFDFNLEIVHTVCDILDISPNIKIVAKDFFADNESGEDIVEKTDDRMIVDYRESINPKHPVVDPLFTSQRYYQVFEQRHGFIHNLSILDLLFCCGRESVFYL